MFVGVYPAFRTATRRFRQDRRGVFAVWYAVMAVPLMLMAGAGLDIMRAVQLRHELQAAADSAALAGATVYTSASTSATAQAVANRYMANAITRMPYNASATYTTTTNATTGSVYSVTVTAKSSVPNSIMALLSNATAVGVTAVAQGAVTNLNISLSTFASSAADANTLYWYIVPSDNSIPDSSALNPLFSNVNGNSATKNISALVGTGQKVGFALKNVTGGIYGYGKNAYGAAQGSTHMFYSHLTPPSSAAYYFQYYNCSMQTTVSGKSSTVNNGSCSLTAPSYPTINCSQAAGKTVTYYWNDMGGPSDDRDYNDAVFNVTCPASSSSSATAASNVILTR